MLNINILFLLNIIYTYYIECIDLLLYTYIIIKYISVHIYDLQTSEAW